MKKINFKKFLISSILITSSFVPTLFMLSCSGATTTQINAPITIAVTGNNFLGSNFSFIPGAQPIFKKNNSNLDKDKDSLFLDYWVNIIAPIYYLSSSSTALDSSTSTSRFLSENASIRDPSFNYAISNSWVSGSDIYVGNDYRFKLMPYKMNIKVNGEIPKIEDKTALTAANIKTEITMSELSINFSYFSVMDGTPYDKVNAVSELKKIFKDIDFKSEYTVNLNLSSKTIYEVQNQSDSKPVAAGVPFDSSKMKVSIENHYYISDLPSISTSNSIKIDEDIIKFKEWTINPANIENKYKNLITSISSL